MICYGPVWFNLDGGRRPFGSSAALCNADPPITGQHRELSTHTPWVNCPACLAILAQRAAVTGPAAATEVVHGGPEGPGDAGRGPFGK